jgi:anti-sigma B factor antagonist
MEETVRDPMREGSALVYFRGNCDLYSAPKFKASILKRIESGVGRILIDMSGIDYLDSTGVGAIISVLQAARRTGGEVRFQGLKGSPRRLLERTSILPLMKEALANPLVGSAEN